MSFTFGTKAETLARLAPLVRLALVPPAWPPSADNEAVLAAYAAQHGMRGLQAAVTGGQYAHPQGLFFGGQAPTWSQITLRQVLREHGTRCARLGWIDLHTGLGPNGHGERIFACKDDAATLTRARAWWGAEVTSIYDGSSASALCSRMRRHRVTLLSQLYVPRADTGDQPLHGLDLPPAVAQSIFFLLLLSLTAGLVVYSRPWGPRWSPGRRPDSQHAQRG
jgi:hypothetical protein